MCRPHRLPSLPRPEGYRGNKAPFITLPSPFCSHLPPLLFQPYPVPRWFWCVNECIENLPPPPHPPEKRHFPWKCSSQKAPAFTQLATPPAWTADGRCSHIPLQTGAELHCFMDVNNSTSKKEYLTLLSRNVEKNIAVKNISKASILLWKFTGWAFCCWKSCWVKLIRSKWSETLFQHVRSHQSTS